MAREISFEFALKDFQLKAHNKTMKRILTPSFRGRWTAFRVMVLLALALGGILIAGTLYAFLRPSGSGPLFRIGGPAGNDLAATGAAGGAAEGREASVFTGIGRLRISLAGGPSASGPTTMILSIAFPYPPGDRAFTEELASKIGDFRTTATDYFSALPAEKLVNLDEETAKTEILRRYNADLRLGKIEALYFSDLIIIE